MLAVWGQWLCPGAPPQPPAIVLSASTQRRGGAQGKTDVEGEGGFSSTCALFWSVQV